METEKTGPAPMLVPGRVHPPCTHCGGTDVRWRHGFRRGRGATARDRAPKWVCGTCHHQWLARPLKSLS